MDRCCPCGSAPAGALPPPPASLQACSGSVGRARGRRRPGTSRRRAEGGQSAALELAHDLGGRGPRRRSLIWLPPRQELAEDGVNAFAMRSDVSLDDAGWGSPTFHKMARAPGGGVPVQRFCTPCACQESPSLPAVSGLQDPADGSAYRHRKRWLSVHMRLEASYVTGKCFREKRIGCLYYQHAMCDAAFALIPAGAGRRPSTAGRGALGPCTDARRAAPQGREKIALIELFTVMGFDILITDVDAVWCAVRRARRCMAEPAAASKSSPVRACGPAQQHQLGSGSRAAPTLPGVPLSQSSSLCRYRRTARFEAALTPRARARGQGAQPGAVHGAVPGRRHPHLQRPPGAPPSPAARPTRGLAAAHR